MIILWTSFPITACHNVRISRRNLFQGKEYLGFKMLVENEFFCGIKVHLIISASGQT